MSVPLPTPVSVLEPSGLLYGSELALLEILGALDPGAFQIEAVLPRAAPLAAHLRRSGVTCRELLGATTAKRSRWKRLLGYARLARHWFRHRPALVYVNQGGILRPAAAIARQLRIPVLCQVQTLEDARWVSRLTAQHHLVSTFVCNSQFIADHCTVPVGRRSTVYLGYKPKGLRRPLPLPSPCHGLLEVTVLGRVCEGKGHYFIVEAARLLKQANLRRFHFRFVGDAATPAEGLRIKTLVKRHRLTEWIEFRGYRDDVAAEFAATHLLAIPSFAKPFGRIFCEAAEAQVPVILADAGGLGELARHFNAGVRFPAGDVGAFIQCLQSIASNYDTVRNGFQTAGTRMLHSLDFSSYLNVIGDLMRRAANGAPVSVQWLGLGSRP